MRREVGKGGFDDGSRSRGDDVWLSPVRTRAISFWCAVRQGFSASALTRPEVRRLAPIATASVRITTAKTSSDQPAARRPESCASSRKTRHPCPPASSPNTRSPSQAEVARPGQTTAGRGQTSVDEGLTPGSQLSDQHADRAGDGDAEDVGAEDVAGRENGRTAASRRRT